MRPSSTTRPSAMRTGDSPDALGAAAAAGAMLPLAASFAAPAPSIWELVGLAWRTGAGRHRRVCCVPLESYELLHISVLGDFGFGAESVDGDHSRRCPSRAWPWQPALAGLLEVHARHGCLQLPSLIGRGMPEPQQLSCRGSSQSFCHEVIQVLPRWLMAARTPANTHPPCRRAACTSPDALWTASAVAQV